MTRMIEPTPATAPRSFTPGLRRKLLVALALALAVPALPTIAFAADPAPAVEAPCTVHRRGHARTPADRVRRRAARADRKREIRALRREVVVLRKDHSYHHPQEHDYSAHAPAAPAPAAAPTVTVRQAPATGTVVVRTVTDYRPYIPRVSTSGQPGVAPAVLPRSAPRARAAASRVQSDLGAPSTLNPSVDFDAAAASSDRTSVRANALRVIEAQVLVAVNRVRSAHGLAPFIAQRAIAQVAAGHSADMAMRGYYAHEAPSAERRTFELRMKAGGVASFGKAAENIARTERPDDVAATLVRMWMASPAHRAAILEAGYHYTGIGIATDGRYFFATQLFVDSVTR